MDKLNFEWECIDYTETEMVLQVFFDNPPIVSTAEEPQILKVVFYAQDVFKDVTDKYIWPMFEVRR